MKIFDTYAMEALAKLNDSITAAKTREDDGIYKVVFLDSPEKADAIAKVFFNKGFDVTLYDTYVPNYYGFFITWDD